MFLFTSPPSRKQPRGDSCGAFFVRANWELAGLFRTEDWFFLPWHITPRRRFGVRSAFAGIASPAGLLPNPGWCRGAGGDSPRLGGEQCAQSGAWEDHCGQKCGYRGRESRRDRVLQHNGVQLTGSESDEVGIQRLEMVRSLIPVCLLCRGLT